MKLYSVDASPFAARIRMQIAIKGLDITINNPPHPLRTEEFRAEFPLGKVPVLVAEDGVQIAESWAIAEFIEDRFPAPALRPADATDAARMRMMARFADLHLGPAVFPLFTAIMNPDAAGAAEAGCANTRAELDKLDRWLGQWPSLAERPADIGDLALVTHLYYARAMFEALDHDDPIPAFDRVAAWEQEIMAIAPVAAGIADLDAGFQAMRQRVS